MNQSPKQYLWGKISAVSDGLNFDILVPPNPEFGDYSTNAAFLIAKKEGRRPVDVAAALAKELNVSEIFDVKIAPNGFINFYLKQEFLDTHPEPEISEIGQQKKVIVEYSSPNIAKPMHIGHLRSTIIGDALANVYEKLGYQVVRWNYIGDWGTQFGKLIVAYNRWGAAYKDADPIGSMLYLYVKFHKEMEESPGLEEEGQKEFKKLEDGNKENHELWEKFRRLSIHELQKTYQDLGIHNFDEYKGESDFVLRGEQMINELVDSSICEKSEGALIVKLDEFNLPPALLRKSDGATLYMTRDIASLEYRIQEEKYQPLDKILYVVANQQALHFEQLFAIAKKIGLHTPELQHVKFGMVLGPDGKKLATREGKVVPLQLVIDEATAKAEQVVKEKNPKLSEEEIQNIAKVVAIGALKYNDLKQHPHTDIKFDWQAMLDFTGNSGPYLQYTYARFANILQKSSSTGESVSPLDPEGNLIVRHLSKYNDALSECIENNTLTGLALYLYELSARMNNFYEHVRVLDEKEEAKKKARLKLIKIASDNLADGLKLLGIQTLDRI